MPKNILILVLLALTTLVLDSCANNSGYSGSVQNLQPSSSGSANRAQVTDEAFWQGNSATIWDRLQHISLKKLESFPPETDPTRAAWIKLAIISKRYSDNTPQLIQQLNAWKNENSGHPGNDLLPDGGTLNSLANHPIPKHIALLLPLQGPMGSSGQAVRNGFLSTYYQSLAKTHIQQTISFYDTNSNANIGTLYQQAVSQGADMVVGPLTKEEVQSLLNSGSFNVPTLALNYTDNSLPSNLYEFGLSPVDEVQQVADKAWQAGRAHAIIIAPQNPWGQRVSKNLISRWKSLGGSVSDTLYYSTQTDFNQSIANLLHVNPQANRSKNSGGDNKENLAQQRRQDFDVIFLLAEPQSAREIVPLLKYYYAEHVPIYSTSVIYSGSPNPQKDTDLNGVIFADIPFVLRGNANKGRLYAVGRDGYVISSELQRLIHLPNFPIYASTGALTLTPTHQIYRRLPMVQIHNGQP